jgi:AAA15 family ATPase/GTPase/5S rRNA maturation endonuclease (ribonuclease M5)
MKLVSFSVTNYRSITTAHKISLGDITVLVGKNNEGKSNILKALSLAMTLIERHSMGGRTIRGRDGRFGDRSYNWNRDFPMSLQNRLKNTDTILKLEFELDASEQINFRTETGIMANQSIPIDIKIGKDLQPNITVPKRGSAAFKKKSAEIANFVSKRTAFNNIPAIRTERDTIVIIQNILNNELSTIEQNQDYKDAIEVIERLQNDVLLSIAQKIKIPLKEFLPNINDVQIKITNSERPLVSFRENVDIIVDDGNPTSIEYKGDGVKSLASLAMLKIFTKAASVIAIEEPEAHLHPEAIHQLVEIINSLSEKNQIILTTHNPLFVCRNNIKSNIIVNQSKASPAKSIKEIRDILGVMPADNLINASYVLVVEGEDDKISLAKILPNLSDKVKKVLSTNNFVIKDIGGAGNLAYELNTLRGFMCKYFVFLDNDDAGREAANKAKERGLLCDADVKYSICNGSPQAEFEDCLNKDCYKDAIQEIFAVNIDVNEFKGNAKWSDRLKNVFLSQGVLWNEQIEKKVKLTVAESIPADANIALNEHKRGSIDALVSAVENMLK